MKKQLLNRLFVMAISGILAINVNAANGTFGGGDGSDETPFLIEDAADLNAVRDNLTASYQLANDIDLAEWIASNSPTDGWDPIADFKGNLDGNGFVISGLWIERATTNNVGLFGSLPGATIKNLGVIIPDGKRIIGNQYVGGIVGHTPYTTTAILIENCFVTGGTIEAKGQAAGGIMGYTSSNSVVVSIRNCYTANSTIISNDGCGGIMGTAYRSILIENCFSTSAIVSTNNDKAAGGIIGGVNDQGASYTIKNSVALNPSIASSTSGRIVGWIKTPSKTVFADNVALTGMPLNGSTVTGVATDKHGLDKTAKELATEAAYAGWDFENTWTMSNGAFPFPVLKVFATTIQPQAFPTGAVYAYTVDVTTSVDGTGGTISDSETGLSAGNNSVTITLTPDANMTLASLLVNGVDKKDDVVSNQYTLTDIVADYTVEATFTSTTGISDSTNDGLIVYLGVDNTITVKNKLSGAQVSVFDAMGHAVAVTNSDQLNISFFPKGIYFVKVQNKVTKIIKK